MALDKLNTLDKLINKNLKFVKHYIAEAYEAPIDAYKTFRIRKVNHSYMLALGRESRLFDMEIMCLKISEASFKDQRYGYAYWQEIAADYRSNFALLTTEIGQISLQSSERKVLRVEIQLVLKSIKLLLRVHNPYDYKTLWRSWGFLKELQ